MGKIILYIATSLDGYVADKGGGVDWLNEYNHPEEDYGYREFFKKIGAVIMGSKTYEQLLSFNYWYDGVESHVFSTRELEATPDHPIQVHSGDPTPLTTRLRQQSRDAWLIGGGRLITSFLNRGLIDELILTIVPKILGDGIPLFQKIEQLHKVELKSCKSFSDGVVQLTYRF